MNTSEIGVGDIIRLSPNETNFFNKLCKNVPTSEFNNSRVTKNFFAKDDGIDGYYYKNDKKVLLQLKNKKVIAKDLNKEINKPEIKEHLKNGLKYLLVTNHEDKKANLISKGIAGEI